MANQDAQANPAKGRIISHMNKEHTRELSHYLRHYANVSPSAASSPQMLDVDLQGMQISAQGKTYSVPFTPALTSWAEVKGRIIEMDTVARDALGISDIYITQYKPPRGLAALPFAGVTFYYICAMALPWVVPGTWAWNLLEIVFPGGAVWWRWVVQVIFVPVVGIHVVECYFLNQKLHRHGVDRVTCPSVWWKWMGSCFMEGFPSFKRLDAMVAKKTAEKSSRS